jgi:hypothetical protein
MGNMLLIGLGKKGCAVSDMRAGRYMLWCKRSGYRSFPQNLCWLKKCSYSNKLQSGICVFSDDTTLSHSTHFKSQCESSRLLQESVLYLYKTQIRPILEYSSHLWSKSAFSGTVLLDRIQKRVCNLIGPELSQKLQPLSHRRDVSSLSFLPLPEWFVLLTTS